MDRSATTGSHRVAARGTALAGLLVVEASSTRAFPRHMHDEFGIGLMRAGAHRSASGRGMVEAAAGQVIAFNPGEVHDGLPLTAAGRSWSMLHLEPRLVAGLAADLSEGRDATVEFERPVDGDPRLAAAVAAVLAAACPQAAAGGAMRLEEGLLDLLVRTSAASARVTRTATVPAAVGRARIDDAPAAPVSLAELAAVAGLTRFELVRAFRRATGLPPYAYLLQRRLHLARALIARGVPLAEAAAASGFADQSHLTRVFARHLGLTPGRYAAALR